MKKIREMTPEEFRLWLAAEKAKRDEMARSRGFRDYDEMAEYVP